ncbi:MAG: DUF177 domain-containing protein [Bacteroidaceae bacterium]|nr:DUF177 domain-containing protein [Bacteroidaceae bacterium]
MGTLDSYIVPLPDASGDNVSYQWHVGDDFFSAVGGTEIQEGSLDVTLRVRETSGGYALDFSFEGTVRIPCDRCLEPMDQPIAASRSLRVRLGDEPDDDGEMITVARTEPTLNVAWNLYELIALEIPLRHVHPQELCKAPLPDEDGSDDEDDAPTDSRWDALKKLINNK